MPEVKYLGDGTAVLVIGEAPARVTSIDGGRTTTSVDQLLVARLDIEEVEAEAVLSERPTFDPDTATWTQPGGEASNVVPATTPSGASDVAAVPARGEAQTAEQLQAEIDALVAQKEALDQTPPPPPGGPPVVEPGTTT